MIPTPANPALALADLVAAPRPARRLVGYPARLTVQDLTAIVDQAVDPGAVYQISGWILQALAGELLAIKAGCPVNRRGHAGRDLPGQGVLFEGAEVDHILDSQDVAPEPGEPPVMGRGWPAPPGTPLERPEARKKAKAKRPKKAPKEAAR